jgi:hypothetical protein
MWGALVRVFLQNGCREEQCVKERGFESQTKANSLRASLEIPLTPGTEVLCYNALCR